MRTKFKHAMRVPSAEEDLIMAKSALDPRLVGYVGEELLNMEDDRGKRYVIEGAETLRC